MNDLTELEQRIRQRLEAATARRDESRETLRRQMDEQERRTAEYCVVAQRLMKEAVHPRMISLASLFPNAHVRDDESTPYRSICSFERTPEYPASTKLSLDVSPDGAIENAVIGYSLEILPIFFQFEGRDQLIVPLDGFDEQAVASWLDAKLLSFTDSYLQLQVVEQYQEENMVVDPVCGMRINWADAATTAEYEGKTYFFCVEECRLKFLSDPVRYAAGLRG